jgi:hypothetical protein
MVFIAIANGALREGWYGKHLSELQAHQISTATGVTMSLTCTPDVAHCIHAHHRVLVL